jgi:uncharacterized protein YneF (UPF0154 family)
MYGIIKAMDTLIHADIFFFVTTIAVIIVTIALAVLAVYLVGVFRDVKGITKQLGEEAVLLRRDIGDLRSEMRRRGAEAGGAMDWLGRFFGTTKKSRSKKKSVK